MDTRKPIDKNKLYRNNFAGRMFRDVADIAARTLFRNDCYDEFLIFAQQSIEKYLKGILLFNEVKHTKSTHRLMILVDLCKTIPHFKISDKAIKFIKNIDGFDGIRYAEYMFGAFSAERDYLIGLDYTVMQLRRYCIADKEMAERLSKVDEQRLVEITRRGGVSFSYLLEKIQKGNVPKYKKLRSNLIWKNLYFSPRVKSIKFQAGWWAKSSGFSQNELRDAYNAVKDYIHIPREVKQYFERSN